jgi:ribosomal protein S18 acetylase RimI-like enzyme
MSRIDIREALPDDAEAIREVQRRTWLATYPNEAYGISKEDIAAHFHEDLQTAKERLERRRRSLSTPPFHAWVALEEETIIGFCIVKHDEYENLVQALYVLPEFQGRRVGRRLLQAVLDWFGAEKDVVLYVAAYNEKAIAFYRTFGFVPAGPVALADTPQLAPGKYIPEISMVKKGSGTEK